MLIHRLDYKKRRKRNTNNAKEDAIKKTRSPKHTNTSSGKPASLSESKVVSVKHTRGGKRTQEGLNQHPGSKKHTKGKGSSRVGKEKKNGGGREGSKKGFGTPTKF